MEPQLQVVAPVGTAPAPGREELPQRTPGHSLIHPGLADDARVADEAMSPVTYAALAMVRGLPPEQQQLLALLGPEQLAAVQHHVQHSRATPVQPKKIQKTGETSSQGDCSGASTTQ